MTFHRRVGFDASDALQPGPAHLKSLFKVCWMRAVDRIVQGILVSSRSTVSIASRRDLPVTSLPSVSTVNEIMQGTARIRAAQTMPIASLTLVNVSADTISASLSAKAAI
jgi:hypothetical protein